MFQFKKSPNEGVHQEVLVIKSVKWKLKELITDMRRLTTGLRSEKCVVRRFRRCANFIEGTYTDLDSLAYYTPRLYCS
jgi:hypothetical protein